MEHLWCEIRFLKTVLATGQFHIWVMEGRMGIIVSRDWVEQEDERKRGRK